MVGGAVNFYECDLLGPVCDAALRPGGTELTGRGIDFCNFPNAACLLDVGCGCGTSVAWLQTRGFSACGVDLSADLLSAGQAAELPLLRASGEALPFCDGSFNGVICECVLCLLSNPAQALGEIFRVLRPGGRLLLSDLYRRAEVPDAVLPDRRQLEELLAAAGFKLYHWEDHSPLLARLAAQFVLTHGSLEVFCAAGSGFGPASERPGYYLLVAEKPH